MSPAILKKLYRGKGSGREEPPETGNVVLSDIDCRSFSKGESVRETRRERPF